MRERPVCALYNYNLSVTTNLVSNGVVKMNVDTDTQWAYWAGVHKYYLNNSARMFKQVGGVFYDFFFDFEYV